jgi:transposase-like protein
MAERGVEVDHVTIYRWVQTFTPVFIDAARPTRHVPGSRWSVDETYVKIAGRCSYLYRAWTSTDKAPAAADARAASAPVAADHRGRARVPAEPASRPR